MKLQSENTLGSFEVALIATVAVELEQTVIHQHCDCAVNVKRVARQSPSARADVSIVELSSGVVVTQASLWIESRRTRVEFKEMQDSRLQVGLVSILARKAATAVFAHSDGSS